MIRGIFEKNGERTELCTSGIEEICPEIHAFPMIARKRIPHRKVDTFTAAQAFFAGVAWGMPFGLLLCTAIANDGALRWWSVASMVVSGFWLYQNFWRKR